MDNPATTAAERLLAALHPTCSHDLPNQILALQSLVNLMDMDEVERLDDTGKEYLVRLKAVAEKMAGMVDLVRSMIRLARRRPQASDVVLADLFRELKAEARSAIATPLTWNLRLLVPAVRVDRDLVYLGLGDLLRALVNGGQSARTVDVTSSGTKVEIVVRGPGAHAVVDALERRGEFLLARERLFVAGVDLKVGPMAVDEARVVLEFASATDS